MAMVFQSYALWPHMTTAQNIAYGLRLRGMARAERARRVDEVLALLGLAGLGARPVTQLSGGQRQRVALGRALAVNPGILLLDEPLSNLDARIRQSVRHEIKALQGQLGITAIHVTHDREEAMVMADRIAIMDAGTIVQLGPAGGDLQPSRLAVRRGVHGRRQRDPARRRTRRAAPSMSRRAPHNAAAVLPFGRRAERARGSPRGRRGRQRRSPTSAARPPVSGPQARPRRAASLVLHGAITPGLLSRRLLSLRGRGRRTAQFMVDDPQAHRDRRPRSASACPPPRCTSIPRLGDPALSRIDSACCRGTITRSSRDSIRGARTPRSDDRRRSPDGVKERALVRCLEATLRTARRPCRAMAAGRSRREA